MAAEVPLPSPALSYLSEVKRWLRSLQLETARQQKKELREYGLVQPWRRRLLATPFVCLAAAVFAAALFFVLSRFVLADKWDLATAMITCLAFVAGYFQWVDTRHEKGLDSFYPRLDLANLRRERSTCVSRMMKSHWDRAVELGGMPRLPWSNPGKGGDDHDCSMYVYAELDNLEYVIEKYRLAYMSRHDALRGLRTFAERCQRREFGQRAWWCVQFSGYNQTTIAVVERVLEKVRDRRLEEEARDREEGYGHARSA